MGKIFYIMGKSSSGKDTIFKQLQQKLTELSTVISYTTRPIRQGEEEGVEYFFVGTDRLQQLKEQKKVIELRSYDTIHGIWQYFTADDGQIELQSNNYLVIGTLESYEKMREYFGAACMVPIYIEVEDGIRLARALTREQTQKEPKYAELCRRFLADTEDFSEEKLSHAGVGKRFSNTDLADVIDEITLYIRTQL